MADISKMTQNTIWDNLRAAIEAQVKRDGVDESYVLPNETKEDLVQDAIDNIYNDVSGLYYWYFDQNDGRTNYLETPANLPQGLTGAVESVVIDDLDAMDDADDLPIGVEVNDTLVKRVTGQLVGYILKWQEWYYDRKVLDAWDAYNEQAQAFNDIYVEGQYGSTDNIGLIYDGFSDVPYSDKA